MTQLKNFHKALAFRRRLVPTIMLLLPILAAGCATTQEKQVTRNGVTVKYKAKTAAGNGVEDMSLAHPVNIREETTRNHLAALRYEELTLFGKEKPVFAADDAGKFAPLITQALSRAGKNSVVYFEGETAGGKTAGDVFAAEKRLHWRIHTLNGMDFSSNAARGWSSAWRLIPKAGQTYHVSERLLWKKTWENWIEAGSNPPPTPALETPRLQTNPRRPKSATTAKHPPAGAPAPAATPETEPLHEAAPAGETRKEPAKPASELEEKLEFLKRLHDKQLIDEKEYERKRGELLDKNL
jgi:hypothetical protein